LVDLGQGVAVPVVAGVLEAEEAATEVVEVEVSVVEEVGTEVVAP
jgi:hypothetical protein